MYQCFENLYRNSSERSFPCGQKIAFKVFGNGIKRKEDRERKT